MTATILHVPEHQLTTLIILHTHRENHHAGVHHTTISVRMQYFIPSTRRHVAKTIRSRVLFKQITRQAYRYPHMPVSPPERTTSSRPFKHVGLDYLGALTSIRDHTTGKVWICLISCMAPRALHLKVVLDNSAQEFLFAFRRFIARRGAPSTVYSHNSTTFHAADSAIQSVLYDSASWQSISGFCVSHKIKWHFITRLSLWKGGFYERMVAIYKSAYRKTVGRTILTREVAQRAPKIHNETNIVL
ncbi:unnamed protein product [Nippostrongylus brasiliensis]|uniref:Integrase catalytic domain-containing protein n=1 Tax=Nippostrongylus brasiliensis TaxID=27835 RepID=A0A0N4XHY8_NIPBR|nr:unnamed protein product [Nippostrongylus brasiliensis]